MAFQPVPNAALIELIFAYNQQSVENTFHVQTDGPVTEVGLAFLANHFKQWWLDNMRTLLSSDIQLAQVVATYKGAQEGPQSIDTTGLPVAGASPVEGLPNGTALVVKQATANIGRSFRGRNYVPGLPNDSVVNSAYVLGTVNSVTTAYNLLRTSVATAGFPLVVVSRRTNGAPRPSGIITPVTNMVVVTPSTRSQRRRNPGIGS